MLTNHSPQSLIATVAAALAAVDETSAPTVSTEVMRLLVEHFDLSSAFVRMNDHKHRTTTMYAEWPAGGTDRSVNPAGVVHFDRADPLVAAQEDQTESVDVPGETSVTTVMPVPVADGSTDGVIGLARAEARPWEADDLATLSAVASLLSMTRARLLAEVRLHHDAHRDRLTGLPNRHSLFAHLEHRLAYTDADPVTALMVTFADVVQLTDRQGHDASDEFIAAAADRLRTALIGTATVFRLAAEEFVIVPLHGTMSDARRMALALRPVLEAPLSVHGVVIVPRIHVGIASALRDAPEPAALLHGLRQAVTHSRNTDGPPISVLNRHIVQSTERRHQIELHIRDAIADGSLHLLYQPEVDLRTRTVRGMEALVRWQHPTLGGLQPDAFLHVVEAMNLAAELGRWVMRTGCAQLREWRTAGLAVDAILRVNVSPREMVDPTFVDSVIETLTDFRLGPGSLCIEVTESVVLHDLDLIGRLVQRLRTAGVRVAIDDFGTGYSGFTQLKALPVDAVKIDRSFVRDVAVNLHDRAIVSAITAMAATFRVDVVAEGVETESAAAALIELGCDYAQGHLFSPPVDAEVMQRLLRDRAVVSAG